MKNTLKEFKIFVLRGNILDFAIGITIGAVFNSLVRSLVNDVIMPPVGFLLGGTDFSEFFIVLGPEKYETLNKAREAGVATINYGVFVNALMGFVITAVAVFFLVKAVNVMREEKEKELGAAVATRLCPYCLTEVPQKAIKCLACASEISLIDEDKN